MKRPRVEEAEKLKIPRHHSSCSSDTAFFLKLSFLGIIALGRFGPPVLFGIAVSKGLAFRVELPFGNKS